MFIKRLINRISTVVNKTKRKLHLKFMEHLEVMNLDIWKHTFTEDECNFSNVDKYLNFIKEAVERFDPSRYSEKHHIMPRCVDKDNKYRSHRVKINGADHFRAHMMLVDCFNGEKKHQLSCALTKMKKNNLEGITGEEYEEARKMFSVSQTGKLNHKYGKKSANAGKIGVTDGVTNAYISATDEIPEGWHRGHIGKGKSMYGEENSIFGRIWITDGVNNKTIPKEVSIPKGWRRGATQNKPDQSGANSYMFGKVSITNGKENRIISPTEELPEGWRYGQTQTHITYNNNQGKMYITNGLKNKMIYKDEIIPDGWRRGMVRNKGI